MIYFCFRKNPLICDMYLKKNQKQFQWWLKNGQHSKSDTISNILDYMEPDEFFFQLLQMPFNQGILTRLNRK